MEDESIDQQSQVMELPDFLSLEIQNFEPVSCFPAGSSKFIDHSNTEQPSIIAFPEPDSETNETKPRSYKVDLDRSGRIVTSTKDDFSLRMTTLSKSFENHRRHQTLEISEDTPQQKEWIKTKKQVFCQVCQLGLSPDQMCQTLKYIESSQVKGSDELILEILDVIVLGSNVQKQPEPKSRERSDAVIPSNPNNIPQVEKVTCVICYDDYEKSQMKHPLKCNHTFCQECYIEYFTNKIATNDLLEVKCPNDDCNEIFTDEQVKALLPKDKFNQYATYKKTKILNSNPNLRWCMKPGCGKYAVGQEDSKFVVCECGTKICFACRNEYHPRQSCDDMLDATYKAYLKRQDVQRCPKCKSGVEKIEGCNHMTCCMCQYQWCWLCGGHYSRNHFSKMNPFGCSGLQSGYNTRNKWPCWKIYVWRFFKFLLFLLFVAALPIIWIFASLAIASEVKYPCYSRRYGRRYRRRRSCCSLLIGIIFLPVFMMITLVMGIHSLYRKLR